MRVRVRFTGFLVLLISFGCASFAQAWQPPPFGVPDLSSDGAPPRVARQPGGTSLAPDQPFAEPISPDENFPLDGINPDLPKLDLSAEMPAPAAAVEAPEETIEETAVQPEADVAAPEVPAEPTAAAPVQPQKLEGSRPIVFKGVEPGVTTKAEVTEAWGAPKTSNEKYASYEVAPFKQVDVVYQDDIAQSLVIHLSRAVAPEKIAGQLGLDEFRIASVFNEAGNTLGLNYPERGVTLAFDLTGEHPQVEKILLKPLSADAFVMRVLQAADDQLEIKLKDIDTAIAIDPKLATAWYLKAELARQTQDFDKAQEYIDAAIALNGESPRFALLKARLSAKLGDYESAIAATTKIAQDETTEPIIRASATQQLGDLIAAAPPHDYNQAVKRQQAAIKLAVAQASSQKVAVRREAKQILIKAHSAIALSIARGTWRNKETTVPQWLERADLLVNDYRKNESNELILSFHLACDSLRAQSACDCKIDTATVAEQAQQVAVNLIGQSKDQLYQQAINLQLGNALIDAVEAQRRQGKAPEALQLAQQAGKILSKYSQVIQGNPELRYQAIRLSFLVGSIHAVQRKDHALAVQHFEHAVDAISQPDLNSDVGHLNSRGEWLVSMAVSYWETEQQEKAVQLTELGLKFLKSSIEGGAATEEALLVPYNNLSFMHSQLGETDTAQQYTNLAEKISTETTQQR